MGRRPPCSTPGCKGRGGKKSGLCKHCVDRAWYQKNKARVCAKNNKRTKKVRGPNFTTRYAITQLQSAMATMEDRTSQIMHFLGMNAPRLPRDVSSVLILVETLMGPVEYPQVVSAAYIRYWAGVFFGVNEDYLTAVGLLLDSKEPWLLFTTFANRLTKKLAKSGGYALQHSTELVMAERYLSAACAHLWHVSYMLCRRMHGHDIAGEAFGEKPSAVKEIVAIAMLH
jgi:hypothetical protein